MSLVARGGSLLVGSDDKLTTNDDCCCDICTGATQGECECGGGTPLPDAIVTVTGSPTTQQLVSTGGSGDYCDPYPGAGTYDPITGYTLYDPLSACASLVGSYVVPCTFAGGGSTDLVWNIFNRVCDGNAADNTFYWQRIVVSHGPGACEVRISSSNVQTNVNLPVSTLLTNAELEDLAPGLSMATASLLIVSNMPADVYCPGNLTVKTCAFAADGYLRQDSPGAVEGGRCGLSNYEVSITR